MIERLAFGLLPDKHHKALLGPEGTLAQECCLTREGFDGPYTITYHTGRPQALRAAAERRAAEPALPALRSLARRHFRTTEAARAEGYATAKSPLLRGPDVTIGISRPETSDDTYVQSTSDELLFVLEGDGIVRCPLGDLAFCSGDYVHLPKGLMRRILCERGGHLLYFEFRDGVSIPSRFRTSSGQLKMEAPYCHRDFKLPVFHAPREEPIRSLLICDEQGSQRFTLEGSPLDVLGWDGSVYPWALPIACFQPRVSSYHLPPTWHGTFSSKRSLVCSFVPRPLDFGRDAIPCPYAHTSNDLDEVIFYVSGRFGSRKGIGPGSLTLHPAGVPHGPHPGRYEQSRGQTQTEELAVMIDTPGPLAPTAAAAAIEDAAYDASFSAR